MQPVMQRGYASRKQAVNFIMQFTVEVDSITDT